MKLHRLFYNDAIVACECHPYKWLDKASIVLIAITIGYFIQVIF